MKMMSMRSKPPPKSKSSAGTLRSPSLPKPTLTSPADNSSGSSGSKGLVSQAAGVGLEGWCVVGQSMRIATLAVSWRPGGSGIPGTSRVVKRARNVQSPPSTAHPHPVHGAMPSQPPPATQLPVHPTQPILPAQPVLPVLPAQPVLPARLQSQRQDTQSAPASPNDRLLHGRLLFFPSPEEDKDTADRHTEEPQLVERAEDRKGDLMEKLWKEEREARRAAESDRDACLERIRLLDAEVAALKVARTNRPAED